ncbi:hypothetical protein [Azospirillum sp. TSO22-1]|nr:hypothetical protein [Azospirillum sp. TSO22-1]
MSGDGLSFGSLPMSWTNAVPTLRPAVSNAIRFHRVTPFPE